MQHAHSLTLPNNNTTSIIINNRITLTSRLLWPEPVLRTLIGAIAQRRRACS